MNNKKILIVSVHPDDETLGCGGTIFKKRDEGAQLYWLIITDIVSGDGFSKSDYNRRQKEINKVGELYGFKKVLKLDFQTIKLDKYPIKEIIDKISVVIKNVKPNIIYLSNRSDSHSDHRVAFDAVMTCTKNFRYPYVEKVLMYETISETEFAPPFLDNAFVPNAFCDITPYIDKKIEIMRVYKGELKDHPFPRSEKNIKALATFRGAMINVEYAEAFMVLKDIF
jgi:LmbE family N-acetylglucosaminyl deacetylase